MHTINNISCVMSQTDQKGNRLEITHFNTLPTLPSFATLKLILLKHITKNINTNLWRHHIQDLGHVALKAYQPQPKLPL